MRSALGFVRAPVTGGVAMSILADNCVFVRHRVLHAHMLFEEALRAVCAIGDGGLFVC